MPQPRCESELLRRLGPRFSVVPVEPNASADQRLQVCIQDTQRQPRSIRLHLGKIVDPRRQRHIPTIELDRQASGQSELRRVTGPAKTEQNPQRPDDAPDCGTKNAGEHHAEQNDPGRQHGKRMHENAGANPPAAESERLPATPV